MQISYDIEITKVLGMAPGLFLTHICAALGNEKSRKLNSIYFNELGFSDNEIKSCRTVLREYGIISEKRVAIGVYNYSVDTKKLDDIMENGLPTKSSSPKSNNIKYLVMAFRELNLGDPLLIGGNASSAKTLMKLYTPKEIAACWSDIVNGTYNKECAKFLNFNFLARNPNIIQGWKQKKQTPTKEEKDIKEYGEYARGR